jgi:hypothetical protein
MMMSLLQPQSGASALPFTQLYVAAILRDELSLSLLTSFKREIVPAQIFPDFLLKFLQEFGIGLTQGRGVLGGGLLPILPRGQGVPVIFAKGLEGSTLLKKLTDSCHGLWKLFHDCYQGCFRGSILTACRGHAVHLEGIEF